jgi:hypothetical protein
MKNTKETLAFDGAAGDGVNRAGNKYAGNHSGLTAKGNYGAGPRCPDMNSQEKMHGHGKPVTKDAYKTAPDTAKGGKINGGRAWAPSAGQNYTGNADKIYIGK